MDINDDGGSALDSLKVNSSGLLEDIRADSEDFEVLSVTPEGKNVISVDGLSSGGGADIITEDVREALELLETSLEVPVAFLGEGEVASEKTLLDLKWEAEVIRELSVAASENVSTD